VLRSRAPGVTRLSAAIALANLPGADSVAAPTEALNDQEYLVQYHSIRSLGQIGDRAALDRLLTIPADPPSRGIALVASQAAARLARRLGLNIQVPQPDLSKWPPLRVRLASDEDD
jgi:HEAT repeat protein